MFKVFQHYTHMQPICRLPAKAGLDEDLKFMNELFDTLKKFNGLSSLELYGVFILACAAFIAAVKAGTIILKALTGTGSKNSPFQINGEFYFVMVLTWIRAVKFKASKLFAR